MTASIVYKPYCYSLPWPSYRRVVAGLVRRRIYTNMNDMPIVQDYHAFNFATLHSCYTVQRHLLHICIRYISKCTGTVYAASFFPHNRFCTANAPASDHFMKGPQYTLLGEIGQRRILNQVSEATAASHSCCVTICTRLAYETAGRYA